MTKWLDGKLLKGFLKENAMYSVLYIAILSFFSYFNSLFNYKNVFFLSAICFLFVYLIKQHFFMIKFYNKEQIITEFNNDEKANQKTKYNTFTLSLLLQLFVPYIIATSINVMLSENATLIFYITSIIKFSFLTSVVLLSWMNFKTIIRKIIFSLYSLVVVLILYFQFNQFVRRFLMGYYSSFLSDENNSNPTFNLINSSSNLDVYLFFYEVILSFYIIAFTITVFFLAKRVLVKNGTEYKSKIALYFLISISSVFWFFIISTRNSNNELIFTLIAVLFLMLLTNILVELLYFLKSFNFMMFIKRFILLFLILTVFSFVLRIDGNDFVNDAPKTENVKQARIIVHDFSNMDSEYLDSRPQILSILKTHYFKSQEAISAIAEVQKAIIPIERSFSNNIKLIGNKYDFYSNENVFLVNIEYKQKATGDIRREYETTIDLGKNLSIFTSLVKTKEYKEDFFEILYINEIASIIMIDSLKDGLIPRSYLVGEMTELKNGIIMALRKDAETNSLLYLVDQDTQYKYTIQLVFGDVKTDTYYIPPEYKNTIAYIEKHSKEFKQI